ELVDGKRRIFSWYRERLAGLRGVTLNAEREGTRNSYWMITVVLDPALDLGKTELMGLLEEGGIDTRPFFHPLSSIPAYASHPSSVGARERNVVSYRVSPYGVNLPSGLQLEEHDVDRVCTLLREILGR
ncbi:MAG: DegT/DnrJ/EryC1/StrS family aminotransferase, partial [Gaiellales bacterium]